MAIFIDAKGVEYDGVESMLRMLEAFLKVLMLQESVDSFSDDLDLDLGEVISSFVVIGRTWLQGHSCISVIHHH